MALTGAGLASWVALVATAALVSAAPGDVVSVAFSAPLGRMAEAVVAVDPRDPARIAAAADPYLDPTRIQVALSRDGGRTWSTPRTVRPRGFSRSFDPGLAFAADGSVLVAGGAARAGPSGCLPGSVIFLARLDGRSLSYELVAGPEPQVFLDRPSLAYDVRTGLTAVSWTRSRGARAHCLAEPVHARTELAWRRRPGAFIRRTLPATGPAVFGSALAITAGARIVLAAAAWRPDRRQRIALAEVDSSSATAKISIWQIPAGRRPSLAPGPRMPLNLFIPTVAVDAAGRTTVAWIESGRKGQRVRLATKEPRGWRPRPGPPVPGLPLAPTITYIADGTLYLAQANLQDGRIRTTLWRESAAGWASGPVIGSARVSGWREFGQAIGLAAGPGLVVCAAPTASGDRSQLSVAAVRFERPRTPSPTPSPGKVKPPAGAAGQEPGWPFAPHWFWVLPLLVISVAGGVLRLTGGRSRDHRHGPHG